MQDGWTVVINQRTNSPETVSIYGLNLLANAIVKEACRDYISCHFSRDRIIIEKFLNSEYGKILLRDCTTPEKIIDHLRGQVERNE